MKLSGFPRKLSRAELGLALKQVLDTSHPGEYEKIGKQGGQLSDFRIQRLFQNEVWIHFHSRQLRDAFMATVRSSPFPEWVDTTATSGSSPAVSIRLYWNLIDPKPVFRRNQAAQKVS